MVLCLGPTQGGPRCTEFLLRVTWSSNCWNIKSTSWSGWVQEPSRIFSQYIRLIIVVCTHWFAMEYTIPIQSNLWLCFLQHKLLEMQTTLHDSSMKWSSSFQSYIVHLRIVAVTKSFFIVLSYTLSLQYVSSVLVQLQVTEVSSFAVVSMYSITYFYFSYLYSFR